MSETAKTARKAMRDKITRITGTDPHQKVDASSWTPSEPLDTTAKTGARPVRGRRYKSGGKVHGSVPKSHAGRKPRKSGGRALTADSLLNRDMVEANEERSGKKHVGAFKRGGRTHKDGGGSMVPTSRMAFQNGPSMMSKAAGLKKGGKVMEHDDEAEDKKLIKRVVKKDALKHGMKHGGEIHADDCRCKKCMGGYTHKNVGGSEGFNQKKVSDRGKQMSAAAMKMASKKGMDPYNSSEESGKAYQTLWKMRRGEPDRKSGGRATRASGGGNWIKSAIKHPGSLHKALHVPKGEKIPAKKLEKAEHSKNPHIARKARLAETLKSFHKSGGGSLDGQMQGTRPTGGRLARKHGGKAGKMNVNIIIAGHHKGGEGMPPAGGMPPQGMPPRPPVMPVPIQALPPGIAAAGGGLPPLPPAGGPPMGGGMPSGASPMMPRKSGGRVGHRGYRSYKNMDAGSGGGFGRLEKSEIQKHKG
jgi:hypothetical protein